MSLVPLLFLTSCATVDTKAIQDKTSGRSVAVAANAGQTLDMLWIGTTVFNNERGTYQLDNKDVLTKAAYASAIEALSTNGRHSNVTETHGISRDQDGFLAKAKGKADFLLLIEPTLLQDRYFGTNQQMRGVGVLQRSAFGSTPQTLVYAVLKGELFDLRTEKSLGSKVASQAFRTPIAMESGPKLPAASVDEITDLAIARVKDATVEIIRAFGLR